MGTVYTKKHAKTFNPYFGIGLQMIISGIALYTIPLATGVSVPVAQIPWHVWSAIGYLVLFGPVISFLA